MSGVGPILLFDKSMLQSLSDDEAVWLDAFYYPNITPLFFVETLADLEKEVAKGRRPEQVVGALAEKTPTGGHPNLHHSLLCAAELLGIQVQMRQRPVIPDGDFVAVGDRRGTMVPEPPERLALQRWEDGNFLDVERAFAQRWRADLSRVDLDATFRKGREIIGKLGRPTDLAQAKAMAEALLAKPGSDNTRDALGWLQCPAETGRRILARWTDAGAPPIKDYAPYSAHVFGVDLFFCLALGADMISRERPSNMVDIAYLYYVPFCMVFTSNDNLHVRSAPLFLNGDQVFIRGQELKADLAQLNTHYAALPEEIKERGVMSFAHYPPTEGDFLTSGLWDKFMAPEWRRYATQPREPRSAEADRRLVDQLRAFNDAPRLHPPAPSATQEADVLVIRRSVPVRRGNWRLVPPEVMAGQPAATPRSSVESSIADQLKRLRDAIEESKHHHPDPWAYSPKVRQWNERAERLLGTASGGGDATANIEAFQSLATEVEGDLDFREARRRC